MEKALFSSHRYQGNPGVGALQEIGNENTAHNGVNQARQKDVNEEKAGLAVQDLCPIYDLCDVEQSACWTFTVTWRSKFCVSYLSSCSIQLCSEEGG